MRLQILEIILWPRNPSFLPRRVQFQPGKVNVISGASQTGKSLVISIIDYCLGSEDFAITERTIRDACIWFGIIIQTDEGKKLLARREPADQLSTTNMYLTEGNEIVVPDSAPIKNTTVNAVKSMLDRLAGLSNIKLDPESTRDGSKERVNFRDLLAFCFQPQNIIANPDVLFFLADTKKHREKLRTIFPYVLGATTPEILVKQWELENLLKELKQKDRELGAQVKASDTWKAELLNWIAEANELGLVDITNYQNYDEQHLIELFRKIVAKHGSEAASPVRGIESSAAAYVNLQKEESELALSLSGIRHRLDQISAVKGKVNDYSSGLKSQRDRLDISRWMRELSESNNGHNCPVCGGTMDDTRNELDSLCDSLTKIESSIKQISVAPVALDNEIATVKSELCKISERLRSVKIQRQAFEERSAAISYASTISSRIDRFLGRAEQALKMFVARTDKTGIQQEVEELSEQVDSLSIQISKSAQERLLKAALVNISNLMGKIIYGLDAQRPDDPVKLDIKDLTVRVGNSYSRSDLLWEMRGGANWLSYHVSATLALQRFFLDKPESPVPTLLIYDQPSHVYVSRRIAYENDTPVDEKIRDEDIEVIRRFFNVFSKTTYDSKDDLQIIVLDRADKEVWGKLEGVVLIEEWRNGQKLVPIEWIPSEKEA